MYSIRSYLCTISAESTGEAAYPIAFLHRFAPTLILAHCEMERTHSSSAHVFPPFCFEQFQKRDWTLDCTIWKTSGLPPRSMSPFSHEYLTCFSYTKDDDDVDDDGVNDYHCWRLWRYRSSEWRPRDVEYLRENSRMSIKEVFVEHRVVVSQCLGQPGKSSCWDLLQRCLVSLVADAADVQRYAIIRVRHVRQLLTSQSSAGSWQWAGTKIIYYYAAYFTGRLTT